MTERGIRSDSRVFIFGFSASGSFANRFTLLHPDRVKAVSAGSPGAYPVAPLAEWKGKRRPFPVGVADLEEIVGRKFDSETFRKVPQQYYIGDDDYDDPAAYTLYVLPELYNLITGLFGGPPGYLRWPSMEQVYRSAGMSAQFAVYPGVAHAYGPGWAEI